MGFMEEKKLFKFKILILILYFFFCLVGLPLIFIFPPRKFLFTENSESDAEKKYLFKNFVSDIYNNINSKLIDEIILTKKNEECPNDYEVLKIEHQYYGNFTHFFGNSTFCIKRKNDEEMNFRKILEDNKLYCELGKKSCGILNKITGALLCINENDKCPLNDLDFGGKSKANEYSSEISDSGGTYFIPIYEKNTNNFLIIDVDFFYKVKYCIERYHKLETPSCEFYDNDICYVEDKINTDRKYIQMNKDENIELNPINLSYYNIKNDNLLEHDYCAGALANNKQFKIFTKGFVNFEREDLKNFLEEFKDIKESNPLSELIDLYKSDKNFETLFYYFSCILLIWSLLQIILIILIFFVKNNDIFDLVHKIYLINGLALLFFKIICFSVLLVSHYSFYLKFKPVYLTIEHEPRNEILSSYKELRIIFIAKIFIIWIVGFITISMELIILCFTKTFIQYQKEIIEPKLDFQENNEDPPIPILMPKPEEFDIHLNSEEVIKEEEKKTEINIDNDINDTKDGKFKLSGGSSIPNIKNNPYKKTQQIELKFLIVGKNYTMQVEPNKTFKEIEPILKSEHDELKNKNFDTYYIDSQIINKNDPVSKYDINDILKSKEIIIFTSEKK